MSESRYSCNHEAPLELLRDWQLKGCETAAISTREKLMEVLRPFEFEQQAPLRVEARVITS